MSGLPDNEGSPTRLSTLDSGLSTPWHLDAVFYEVSVKSFFDSNGDGIGDEGKDESAPPDAGGKHP